LAVGSAGACDLDLEEDDLINGFACDAEVRAFVICCPACGAVHDIKATDRLSRRFDRRRQRFRCGRCRFAASVSIVVKCAVAAEEPIGRAEPSLPIAN
jgi:hypothetical protein